MMMTSCSLGSIRKVGICARYGQIRICRDPRWTAPSNEAKCQLPPALPNLRETPQWNALEAILSPTATREELPPDYCCPITSSLMREPVVTCDGHTYEREAIETWLKSHNTSPLTGAVLLENKNLTPVLFVRNAVNSLLDKHPELRDSKEWYLPESWVRALGRACEDGDEAAIRELIHRDRRLLVHTFGLKSEHEGKTALQLAVLASKPKALEVAVELLERRERGLALAALLQVNEIGLVPLHQAILAKRDCDTLIKLMAWMGDSLDLIGAPQNWPLNNAQEAEALGITKTLNSALIWSVTHRDLVKAACLLRLRASPDAHDRQGERALCLAVQQAHQEEKEDRLVKLLLQADADPNLLNVADEDAPLHCAINNDLLATALELVQAGAALDLRLADGTTPLHLVAGKQTTAMADALWGGSKQLSQIDLEAVSGKERYTALHWAAKSGSSAMLSWLLSRGAHVLAATPKGHTILHLAALHNHKQIAQEVLKLKNVSVASLAAPDCEGNTPLHLAAQTASSDMMCWLLSEFGALSSRNLAGQLPRDLAKSLGQAAVVQAYDDAIAMLKAKEEATLLQQGDLASCC